MSEQVPEQRTGETAEEATTRVQPVEPKPKRTPKPKRQSREDQWNEACAEARKAFDDLQVAFGKLNDLRSEYESWKDNLPESLQTSPVGEKLEAVCELDFESLNDLDETISNAEGMDLPKGFGRD